MSKHEKDSSNAKAIALSEVAHGQSEIILRTKPWAKFVPGPAPSSRARSFPPAVMRYGVTSVGCVIMMISGYNHALMGSVSSQPAYLELVGLADGASRSQLLIGTINALYYVGVMLGALIIGSFSDRVGRRKACVTSGIFALTTIAIFTGLQNFAWALVGRMLMGLCIGAFDAVGLNWSAESAKTNHRGLALGLAMSAAAFGASQSYFISYGLSRSLSSSFVFRFTIAFQVVYVTYVMITSFLLPESPRWLVKVGLFDEARNILDEMSSDDGLNQPGHLQKIENDLSTIRVAIDEERDQNASASYLSMLFTRDSFSTARRSWSAIFVQFACQFMVGASFVATYGIQIFQSGGWTGSLAALLAGFGIVTQAVFGLPGAILSDKIGRRPALIGGSFFGSVLLMFIGMCGFFVSKHADTEPATAKKFSTAVIILLYLWCAQFGLTWLWCPFVYPSEIFVAQSRAKGSSLGVVGFGLGSFVCNMVSPYLFSSIGSNALFLIGSLSLITSLICFVFMPETAKRSLEDIDDLFKSK